MSQVMDKEKVKDIIKEIIKGNHIASLATIKEGKPWVRYVMTINPEDTLNLFIATSITSRKIAQIKEDPNVHICLGWDEKKPGPYVQYVAKAKVHTDSEIKKKYWQPVFEMHFKNPDDPNYCIIELVPEYIEVFGYEGDMKSFLQWEP